MNYTTTINLLPDEILLKIIEATGLDIINIKLRQVSKKWKTSMDKVLKDLFQDYQNSPILKSLSEVKQLNPNQNHIQRVKAVYLAVKKHIKDIQKIDPYIYSLSVLDLERMEKIYRAPNFIKVFREMASQSPVASK